MRRLTREVQVGAIALGGANPICVQSMITCDTMDTEACVQQTLDLVAVGCEIVRITAPTIKDARNLELIKAGLLARGCDVPLVADIHFKPDAALEAARWVEKVRINPGNFVDSKKFKIREYTDAEYAAELDRIRERFTPLVVLCKELGRAMRIGTNHGSLSDRIMNRYGDTPLGMVESALEFARIARDLDYHNFVFSMKASNPKVMIQAYRLLVARLASLDAQPMGNGECELRNEATPRSGQTISPSAFPISHSSWNYPIHLGVTEAGDGEDGRIKSAIGIGSLLRDGIGDTVRVSLTEDSVQEIPVARELIAVSSDAGEAVHPPATHYQPPDTYARRASSRILVTDTPVGAAETVRIVVHRATHEALAHKLDKLGDYQPEIILDQSGVTEIDPTDEAAIATANASRTALFVTIPDSCALPVIDAYRLLAGMLDPRHPILLKDTFTPQVTDHPSPITALLTASTHLGSLLCDGIGDAVLIQGEPAPGQSLRLAYHILQATGVRIFKTDYVACPSCGRTLFDLQSTTARIRASTDHLKGVRIAVMGCIVNGPGEMADADFGYVGGAPGKINLYVGKTAVKFNIPESEAVDQLVDLIREHGKWVEPRVRQD